jgi:hypothetical protein
MARQLQIFRDMAIHALDIRQSATFPEVPVRSFYPAVWVVAVLLAVTSLVVLSQKVIVSVKGIVVLPGATSHTDESLFLILLPTADRSLIQPRAPVSIVDIESGQKTTGQIVALMSGEQGAGFISAYCECDLNAAKVSLPVSVAIARWSSQKPHDPVGLRPSKALLTATIEVITTPRKVMFLKRT